MVKAQEKQIGENIRASIQGPDIVIRINKDRRGGLSASGKTIRVASTCGNIKYEDVTLGINAYVKPD